MALKSVLAISDELKAWEVRVTGLPRSLIMGTNKDMVKAIYKKKYNLFREDLDFVECSPCQPLATK